MDIKAITLEVRKKTNKKHIVVLASGKCICTDRDDLVLTHFEKDGKSGIGISVPQNEVEIW